MITSSILLIFLGCFFLYNTSTEVVLSNKLILERWIQRKASLSKIIAVGILFFGLATMIFSLGRFSGIILWLFLITIILSLLVVIYPLKKINYKHILLLFIISLLVELIIN